MTRTLVLAALLTFSVSALAAGPAHSPGSTAPSAKAAPMHCNEHTTDAKDAQHGCVCDPKKPSSRLPSDLSEMIEEHFLSVQAEPGTAAL
jgi:hypothetical protein